MKSIITLVLSLTLFCISLSAQVNARLFQYPDVSETHITFTYGGDIWIASKEGGMASRLSSPKGAEVFPRFSPDGSQIAFSGNYDGNLDVYVIPSQGGLPTRVTHHGMGDRLLDWYPDGKHLLGRFRISLTDSPSPFRTKELPAALADALKTPTEKRTDEQRKVLSDHYRSIDATWQRLVAEVTRSEGQLAQSRLIGVQDLAWALINTPAFLFNR